jgi:ABC-type transporter MlaC component
MFKSILSFALTLLAFSAMLTAANTDDPQGDFISDTDALLKRYV